MSTLRKTVAAPEAEGQSAEKPVPFLDRPGCGSLFVSRAEAETERARALAAIRDLPDCADWTLTIRQLTPDRWTETFERLRSSRHLRDRPGRACCLTHLPPLLVDPGDPGQSGAARLSRAQYVTKGPANNFKSSRTPREVGPAARRDRPAPLSGPRTSSVASPVVRTSTTARAGY